MPVVELMPVGTASPKACVSRSTSASVAPGPTQARRAATSTRTDFIVRQIDHQAAIADGVAGNVVAAAAHGDEKSVFPGKIHGGDDVGGADATHDQAGPPVDHGIPDAACVIVGGVAFPQHRAA